MFPWVCSVLDHRRRQSKVKTPVTLLPAALVHTSLFFQCFDITYDLLGSINNRTGMPVDDGKVHGKDQTRLPVPNLPICHWSRQLFDLRMPSSTDIAVLLLNQPIT